MRRGWWDTFFGRDDDDDETEDQEPEDGDAPMREAAPVSLEPPIIRRLNPVYEETSAPPEDPPAPVAPDPHYPAPPDPARAVGQWAGGEAAALLAELPPDPRQRVAEALSLWRETEDRLARCLERSDAIAELTGPLLSGPLADPEFAQDAESLRAATGQQNAALRALTEGARARARAWILAAIQGTRTWPPQKAARLFEITGIGPFTLADLMPRLRSMEAGPRIWVAEALGLMSDTESGQALLGLLRDPDADVRATAVAALGKKGDTSLLHALGAVIKRDPDWLVRLRAIQAAQSVQGYEAIGFLQDLLNDAAWWRELQVLDSMGRSSAPEGTHDRVRTEVVNSLLAKVQAALPGADPAHRAWLMEVLGDTGDARAVPLLSSAMHDADLEVRLRAIRGLGRLGGAAIVDILIPALKDQQPEVRIRAAEALGDANDFRALEPLLETMRADDELVRAAAVAAIGKLWDRKALAPMMDAMAALNDPDQKTREEFRRAMQRMADPRTMNIVMNMLEAGGMRTRRPGS